jgi:hypothetical protein
VFKITTIQNSINASPPTEVGFFIYHLVRHNTVESTKHIDQQLTSPHPKFQTEMSTIWSNYNNTRLGVGVLNIYSKLEDKQELATLFSNKFNHPTHMSFIRSDYYKTLDQETKANYCESHRTYVTNHRTLILPGIKNIDVQTTIKKRDNSCMKISEWLLTIPDYKGAQLFQKAMVTHTQVLELQITMTNISVA